MKIAHAHPANNAEDDSGPYENHNHSDKELLLLSLFTNSHASLTVIDPCPGAFFYDEGEFIVFQAQTDLIRQPLDHKLLRAPPVDILLNS